MGGWSTKDKAAEYQSKWRARHPGRTRELALESYIRHRAARCAEQNLRAKKNRDYVYALKCAPCLDCGQTFMPVVMQFDHTGDDKNTTVSRMVSRGSSKAAIDAEIAKCDLVCPNDHTVRTHRRGYKKSGRPPKYEMTVCTYQVTLSDFCVYGSFTRPA